MARTSLVRRSIRNHDSRGIRHADRRAYMLVRRLRDFDIREAVKSKLKEGATAVAGAMDWVSSKIKEKVDPAQFASEKEAAFAQKQKLKDLSTVKGLLKEIFRLLKTKIKTPQMLKDVGEKIANKAKALVSFIKSHIVGVSVGAAVSLIGVLISVGYKLMNSGSKLEEGPFEEIGPRKRKFEGRGPIASQTPGGRERRATRRPIG